MSRLIVDERTRRSVFVAAERAARPTGGAACPFCPGGREARDGAAAPFSFPNRWPALPSGECAVVVHSDEHDQDFATMPVRAIRGVLDLWAAMTARTLSSREVSTVLIFENRGAEAGATVDHAHSQLFGLPVTPQPLRAGAGPCPSCRAAAPELVVLGDESWVVAVPEAPLAPFAARITPRRHVGALADLYDAERDALAATVRAVVRAFDGLFGQKMPYHLWVTQAGVADTALHLCVDIVGLLRAPGRLRVLGAAETATGMAFTPMNPQVAAGRLRTAAAGSSAT